MGWIPYSSAYCQARVGSYCYVLSHHMLKTNATQVPKWVMLIHGGELPGMSVRRPGSLSPFAGRERVRRTGGEIQSVCTYHRVEK
jgi:hypothetical protein